MTRSRFPRAAALLTGAATLLAAAGGAAALGAGTAPAAPAAPTVTVSDAGPYADGQTVTVSGEGFSGADPGLYVGLVQDDRFSTVDAAAWMTTDFLRPAQIADGRWTVEIALPAATEAGDCTVNACSIYTVAAHGSPDRSQDSRTPVSFLGGVQPAGGSAPGGAATAAAASSEGPEGFVAGDVTVTLSKSEDLDPASELVTVTGEDFSGEGAGIYVGLVEDDRFSVADASAWMTTAWIGSGEIVDGKWTAEIELPARHGESDCTVNQCAVYTIAAHGSPDRTQDSRTPVSFTGAASGSAAGTSGGADSAAGHGSGSSSTDRTWLWVLVGVLGGGGAAVGGLFVARRVRGTGTGA